MYKKITLSIGALAAIAAPAAMAISCGGGSDNMDVKIKVDNVEKETKLNWAKKASEGYKIEVIYGTRWKKVVYDTNDVKVDDPVWVRTDYTNDRWIFDLRHDDSSGKWYAYYSGGKIYEEDFENTIKVGEIDFREWFDNQSEQQTINYMKENNRNHGTTGVILEASKVRSIKYIKE